MGYPILKIRKGCVPQFWNKSDISIHIALNCYNCYVTDAKVRANNNNNDNNMDDMAIELVQEIGRRTTVITQDTRETIFLFQRLSIALQRGNAVSFLNTMNTE